MAAPMNPHLAGVGRYFFRLGCVAFGGPAAHVALMRRELVAQRGWVTDQQFADIFGVSNLIPGPNSTETAMHIGGLRAGWAGVWVAGAAFIAPAVAIVLAFAWLYDEYGTTTGGEALLDGVQPVVLAIILQAIWGLRRATVATPAALVIVAAAVVLALLGVDEIFVLLGAGAALLLAHITTRGTTSHPWPAAVRGRFAAAWERLGRLVSAQQAWMITSLGPHAVILPLVAAQAATPASYSAGELFLVFLKIGGTLYGSGYVLVSFMQSELVDSRHWLTDRQLLDAIAVGQFTPGPVFATATFAGYVIDGFRGAALATAGIFLPSFVFVAATHPLVPRLREWRWTRPFLDGVNAAAVALMALVTIELARDSLDGPFEIALFLAAAFALIRFSPNSALIVLAGAAAGLIRAAVT